MICIYIIILRYKYWVIEYDVKIRESSAWFRILLNFFVCNSSLRHVLQQLNNENKIYFFPVGVQCFGVHWINQLGDCLRIRSLLYSIFCSVWAVNNPKVGIAVFITGQAHISCFDHESQGPFNVINALVNNKNRISCKVDTQSGYNMAAVSRYWNL